MSPPAAGIEPDVGPLALPESVRSLSVCAALVEAGLPSDRAEHLDYIVDQVYFTGAERRERLVRFAVLIVLSTMIATFGLLSDSVAVVIGAMLVAPLMTPILGMAVSIVLTEARQLLASARTVLAGGLGAVAVGWILTLVAGGSISVDNLPGEVLGRTSPGLLDLGVAVAAGLTGGYLMVDRKAAASAAGVAIAVALVPPLATVGICLQVGSTTLALGALLLFATNLVAIVLSASLVILVAGPIPRRFLRARFRNLRANFAAVLVAVVVVTVPLAIHTASTIQQEQFQRGVADAVHTWDGRAQIMSVTTSAGPAWDVTLQLAVPDDPSPTWQLAQLITDRTGKPVNLDVSYLTRTRDRAATR